MIQARLLLNAICSRVRIWDFIDIYTSRDTSRREAARLFVEGYNGVKVKQTGPKTFVVLAWKIKIEK